MMVQPRRSLFFGALSTFVLLFVAVTYISVLTPTMERPWLSTQDSAVKQKLQLAHSCILKRFAQNRGAVWDNLHLIINTCASNATLSGRHLKFIKFSTDKLFLPFYPRADPTLLTENGQLSCNVVTLGVGGEVIYEKQLKEPYEFCKFYAADPFEETGKAFLDVGEVYYTAVDNYTGESGLLMVLRDGKYDWQSNVPATSLGDFLKRTLKLRTVHFLSMDIEGAEYRVLPLLHKFARADADSVICQISMEFHGPIQDYNVSTEAFETMLTTFLWTKTFVPLRALFPGSHHRFFLFNMANDYCEKLFLGD